MAARERLCGRTCLQVPQGVANAGVFSQSLQGSDCVAAQLQCGQKLLSAGGGSVTEHIQQHFQTICGADSLSGVSVPIPQCLDLSLQ